MSAREVAPAKKSRAGEKKVVPVRKSRTSEKKVAPSKKSRAKGKKVFARKKQEYIPNIMLYVRVYGTNRAPYFRKGRKYQFPGKKNISLHEGNP